MRGGQMGQHIQQHHGIQPPGNSGHQGFTGLASALLQKARFNMGGQIHHQPRT
jgi:hypothetical protein